MRVACESPAGTRKPERKHVPRVEEHRVYALPGFLAA
jgi:hypothetical protein